MDLDFSLEFNKLIEKAQLALFEATPIHILRVGKNAQKADRAILAQIHATGGNVYLLWGRNNTTKDWYPLYLGQRKQKEMRTRLSQHLFSVHPMTESKLKRVEAYVNDGGEIGISVILVKPDELRTSVEQRLIQNNRGKSQGWLAWNTHS